MEDVIWIENCIKEAEKNNDSEMVQYFVEMLERIAE